MSVQGVASIGQGSPTWPVAGSLGGLNLGQEKDGSYHAPPSSQLLGMPSHLDYHALPDPHLGLPSVTPVERCPGEVSCTYQACWLPPLP